MNGMAHQPHIVEVSIPPVLDKSWHQIGSHLIQVELLETDVKIVLTNTKLLWQTILSKDNVVKLAKSQNSVMEASNETFLSLSMKLLCEDLKNVTSQSSENGSSVTCLFKTSFQDFSFSLSVELQLVDLEQYYKDITLPLLASIDQMHREREELMKLIQQKDEEIAEYKLAGATVSRRGIATKYFNKEEFLKTSKSKDTTGDLPFRADDVCRNMLLSYSQISDKYEKKKEEMVIKTEPDLLSPQQPSTSASNQKSASKRQSMPERPVFSLSKRPRNGKLAKLL